MRDLISKVIRYKGHKGLAELTAGFFDKTRSYK